KLRYMIMALVVLSVASLFIGVSDLSPSDLLDLTDDQWKVLLISRFPRMVSILIAGASMSIIGLIMQQLSKNKFVLSSSDSTMYSAQLYFLVSLMLFFYAGLMTIFIFFCLFALGGTFVFMKNMYYIKFKYPVFITFVGLM